jgi:hypothetical protein
MLRWLVILAVLLPLTGCATTYRGYSTHEPVRVGGSTYYAPAYASHDGYASGYGDYYYGSVSVGPRYHYPTWIDNPYYYSLFWPMQRSFYDPFWNPGFYYGVTYFPRNYFSISLYGGHRSYYSRWGGSYGFGFAYSPYRLSWVDHYYDWYPHHRFYPRHATRWYAPRYGNARHEAERLARYARHQPSYARQDRNLPRTTDYRSQAGYGSARGQADYHGRTAARLDPGVRGFDRLDARQRADVRAADYGQRERGASRIDPGVRGFDRNDARQRADVRGADYAQRERGASRIDPGVRGFDRADPERAAMIDARQRGQMPHDERFARGRGDDGSIRDGGELRSLQQREAIALRRQAAMPAHAGRDGGYRVVERGGREGYALPQRAGREAPRGSFDAPIERRGYDAGAPAYRQAPAPQRSAYVEQRVAPRIDARMPPQAAQSYGHPAPPPVQSAPRAAPAEQVARGGRSEARQQAGDRGESRRRGEPGEDRYR